MRDTQQGESEGALFLGSNRNSSLIAQSLLNFAYCSVNLDWCSGLAVGLCFPVQIKQAAA